MATDFLLSGNEDLLKKIRNELSDIKTSNISQVNDDFLALESINPQDIKNIFELAIYGLEASAVIIDIITKIKNLLAKKESIEIRTEVGTHIVINNNIAEVQIIEFVDKTVINIQKN